VGFLELLTIVFVVLKALGVISWGWWVVFSPAILAALFYVIWFLVVTTFFRRTHKEIRKNEDIFGEW